MAKATKEKKKGEVLFIAPLVLKKSQIVVGPEGVKTEVGLFRNDEASSKNNFEIYIILAGERYVIKRGAEEEKAKIEYGKLIKGLVNGTKKLTLAVETHGFNISAEGS